MKGYLIIISFLLLTISSLTAQETKNQKHDPIGKWRFEAPYAPEGYNSGTFVIGIKENKHTVEMSLTGTDYKFIGDSVKTEKDLITFTVSLEGEIITITLKPSEQGKMSGTAAYTEGEVPFTLTRDTSVK
jgi:hypothetical protein